MRKFFSKRNILLLFLFFVAAFLRFYNLEKTAMFLGDQGRDAIIVKRIVTLEHLPAIGPPSSIGQVYLGPFYYYLIAPFLLIFRFNPVGLAFAVGFYSLLLSFLTYKLLKGIVNKNLRITLLFLLLFSPILLEFSRFSWNPNLLPYFSFLTSITFIKALKEKSRKWSLIFGLLAGLSLQLHYSFLFLLPIYFLYALWKMEAKKINPRTFLILFLLSSLSFLLSISPLIFFDLRHQFLNTKNFLKLLNETKAQSYNFLLTLKLAFLNFSKFALSKNIPTILSILITSLTLIYTLFKIDFLSSLFFSQILIFLAIISLFNFRPIPHYFGAIYPAFYFLLSKALAENSSFKRILIIFSFLFITWLPSYKSILSTPPQPQIAYARKVARKIFPLAGRKYQLIALPPWESTKHFRYFLELWGKRPLEEHSPKIGDSLIIVCYKPCPDPIGDPQWQIAAFPNKKIDKILKLKNLTIVKIINEKKR